MEYGKVTNLINGEHGRSIYLTVETSHSPDQPPRLKVESRPGYAQGYVDLTDENAVEALLEELGEAIWGRAQREREAWSKIVEAALDKALSARQKLKGTA